MYAYLNMCVCVCSVYLCVYIYIHICMYACMPPRAGYTWRPSLARILVTNISGGSSAGPWPCRVNSDFLSSPLPAPSRSPFPAQPLLDFHLIHLFIFLCNHQNKVKKKSRKVSKEPIGSSKPMGYQLRVRVRPPFTEVGAAFFRPFAPGGTVICSNG